MSIDVLQEKIRKLKNPSMIDFAANAEHIPAHLLEQEHSVTAAYGRFCRELMQALKDTVPAVRFSFTAFALLGNEGQTLLADLLREAHELGYYVVLDGPETNTPWAAQRAAALFSDVSPYYCDGMIISPYIGSDGIKPFLPYCKENQKDLFLIVRTPNRTAAELQDLLSGSRLVHMAAADIVNRHAEPILGRCGYSRVAALTSAGSADSLRNLRAKYNRVFLLVDGLDYPSGNAKNCSYAFDRFGHGAVICAGPSVTAAWITNETDGQDYTQQALAAAERMKKNILRYIAVL
jgi:orotidine-5'-phosphate decarboxylase